MNPTLIITVDDIICAILALIIFLFLILCVIDYLLHKAKQILERKDKDKHD